MPSKPIWLLIAAFALLFFPLLLSWKSKVLWDKSRAWEKGFAREFFKSRGKK